MTATAVAVRARPRAVAQQPCPLCEETAATIFLTAAQIAAELHARDRFFAARLDPRFSREGFRDVTDVVLGTPAPILRCVGCGVLIRDAAPAEDVFREDRYDDDLLEILHATHAQAFEGKERDYRPLAPPGARVFEVGSYVGGFLRAAAKWGWRVRGADIGRDVVRFCRSRGMDVQCLPFERCNLEARSLDQLFVWNCFEQIEQPVEFLAEARRVLRRGGLLVIRVPDADFYIRTRQQDVLAYNALLGWPHRFGYDAEALRHLVEREGFALVRVLRRPAVRPFREAMHSWARDEEARVIGESGHGWIEATFRQDRELAS